MLPHSNDRRNPTHQGNHQFLWGRRDLDALVTSIHLISRSYDIWFAWLDGIGVLQTKSSLSSLQQSRNTFDALSYAHKHILVHDAYQIRYRNGVQLQSSFIFYLLRDRNLALFLLRTWVSCTHRCTLDLLLQAPLILFIHQYQIILRGEVLQLVHCPASSCPTRECAHLWKLKRTPFQSYLRTSRHHKPGHGAIFLG